MRVAAALFAPLILFSAAAQQPTQPSALVSAGPTGAVAGHVYFAGSNAPARFASVALQPIAVKAEDRPYQDQLNDPPIRVYETLLDGSFQMAKVPAGSYYVVVKYPGYLSPFSQFTNTELVHPTPDVQQRIDQSLPVVRVAANNTANIDVRLSRGASVSGTVSFDDGTPYAGAQLSLMQHDAAGKWVNVRLGGNATADDQGRFRMSGLLAGEYILRVRLALDDIFQNNVLNGPTSMRTMSRFSLAYYSGDTPRQRDAQSFKLNDGQDLASQALAIPISKIHAVSGSVVEDGTGRAVNKATVAVLFADDKVQLTTALVDPDEPGYRFSFLPDGEYLIKVMSASDVVRDANSGNAFSNLRGGPPVRPKETVLRTYKPSEPQPLVVHGDMQAVNLPVTLAPDNKVPDAKPAGSD